MSLRDRDADGPHPFDGDPFGSAPPMAPATPPGPPPPVPPTGEVNTLATLSVVFAFVFAPAGAVLGHLALAQIKRRRQPGHRRAVLGVTLSYVVIALAVIALLVWLLLGSAGRDNSTTVPTTTLPPPLTKSTVITPPAQGRPRVSVTELRVGDCVEIQKNQPDPTRARTDQVYIYRAPCEVRDGIFQVRQMASNGGQCPPGEYLTNDQETVVACFVKYGQ
ncbi:DUF4190 domain-containing protein [Mycobacterium intracellulare]|uniref:DUF4190 domain-containing protein n=1 Tax=Mycobacterium intracellulare TaxID=1767 RepID=UPI000BAED2BF|nr:DUF4190 domain-containing protein [Mycobacterium intracellulare]PBA57192.1 hypothetical protein CKJ57_22475 [Mycobacterium intracellulare subsp. chimaera]